MYKLLAVSFLILCNSGLSLAQSKIIFSRSPGTLNTGGTPNLMMYDPATAEIKMLLKGTVNRRGEYSVSTSPNNSKIITNTYKFSGWKLGIADLVDGKLSGMKKFTNRRNYEYNAAWSHSGEYVAYQEYDWGSNEMDIFIADKNGRNSRQFTTAEGGDRFPVWTLDDKHIVFTSGRDTSYDIYIKPIEEGEIKRLTNNPATDFAPSTSKSHKKIAFLSDRGGYINLYTMDYDGKNMKNLTSGHKFKSVESFASFQENGYWAYQTSWSPDGKKIVFTQLTDKGIELFIINADGSNLQQITDNRDADFNPYWML